MSAKNYLTRINTTQRKHVYGLYDYYALYKFMFYITFILHYLDM